MKKRVELNDISSKYTIERINKVEIRVFEKANKIVKWQY
jgi:hypothetical protein